MPPEEVPFVRKKKEVPVEVSIEEIKEISNKKKAPYKEVKKTDVKRK